MLNCIATKPDARKILFQLWKGGEVGMTVKEAVKHLENLKWLKGYSNTTVDGVPIGNVIDGIIALLKEQEPRVMTLEEVNALDWDYCYLEQERLPGKEYRWLLGKYIMTCVTWPSITAAKISQGKDNYGRTWRCWTSRPTEEQRKKEPWNG